MVSVALAVLLVDQLTKVGYGDPVNSGLAFSRGQGAQSWVQLAGSVILVAAVAWLLRRCPWWALGLALGGLMSNLADRVVYGGVRDPIAWGPYWWNLADLAALVGLALCLIYYVRGGEDAWTS